MRRLPAYLAIAALLFVLPACGKKKEDAKKPAAVAAAKADDQAKAAAAKVTAVKAAAAKAAVAPAPADVKLVAGDNVVAWLSARSLSAVFDASETIGGQIGALPPGASVREAFYRDMTRALADQGVTGHEWLDKAKPLHIFLQDDDPANLVGGVVVMLPMTSEAAAKGALKSAKTGVEAKGHSALLKPSRPGQPAAAGGPEAYIDFLGKYMVVTSTHARFGKAKGFAGRIAALKPPALVYLGVSVTDAATTRKPQIEALLSQFARMQKVQQPGAAANFDYYNKVMRQWLAELARIEITVDGDSGYVKIGGRAHAVVGSALAKQFSGGKGRDARPAAASLPGNSYISFVTDMDPQAGLGQLQQSMKMLNKMFNLPPEKTVELEKDIRATAKLQTGVSAMAMYRDGPTAQGALAWFGSRDPAVTLKALKNVVGEVGVAVIAQEKAGKIKALSKAEEAQLAVVERALKARTLEPILTTYGPMAKEMGIAINSNTTKGDGASCDVLDIVMDWKKISAAGDKEAQIAKSMVGDRTAIALCTSKDRISLSVGPSALEQGRRAALGKKGGLIDAPVYAAAAKRSVGAPSTFGYVNLGALTSALSKVIPPLPVKFPADRPLTLLCGNRTASYACSFSVPVQAIGAAMTLARGR